MNHRPQVCVGVASYAPWLRLGIVSLEEFAVECANLGFTAIEPCDRSIEYTDETYLSRLSDSLENMGLTIPCIDVRNDFTVKDSIEWRSNIAHVERWIRVANFLEVPVIRIWAGVRSTDDGAPNRVYRALEELVPVAERYNVRMALENHGGISSNPDLIVRLVKSINSPYVGTCPDFGHLAPDDRYDGLDQLIPLSFHIHAKAHEIRDDGEEADMDYGRIMSLISYHLPSVFLSIEYEGKVQAIRDNIEGIMKTFMLIQKHWPVHAAQMSMELAPASD